MLIINWPRRPIIIRDNNEHVLKNVKILKMLIMIIMKWSPRDDYDHNVGHTHMNTARNVRNVRNNGNVEHN